jgi:hypothetical protein
LHDILILELRLKKRKRQQKSNLSHRRGKNEDEEENHPIPDKNSEALKEFCRAGYELLVKAKDAANIPLVRSAKKVKIDRY